MDIVYVACIFTRVYEASKFVETFLHSTISRPPSVASFELIGRKEHCLYLPNQLIDSLAPSLKPINFHFHEILKKNSFGCSRVNQFRKERQVHEVRARANKGKNSSTETPKCDPQVCTTLRPIRSIKFHLNKLK